PETKPAEGSAQRCSTSPVAEPQQPGEPGSGSTPGPPTPSSTTTTAAKDSPTFAPPVTPTAAAERCSNGPHMPRPAAARPSPTPPGPSPNPSTSKERPIRIRDDQQPGTFTQHSG